MAVRTKKKIYLEYRYDKSAPWKVYDWTQVYAWADSAEAQMKKEHPGAEHRRRTV